MNIDTLKSLFETLSNEYQLGSVSGEEFSSIANLAQRDYFNFLMGHIEQFQYGRPVPRIGLGMGDKVRSKLSPFVRSATVNAANGVVAKPDGVARLEYMSTSAGVEIRPMDINQRDAIVNSSVVPIEQYPRYIDRDGSWLILPSINYQNLSLDYIVEPTDMKWNYTTQNQRERYSPTGSVDPQWKDTDINHILSRMLKHFGVPMKDGELINIANAQINTGE